jgi:hypothetical protein
MNRAMSDDPQSALPFLPFPGGTPNANTALTPDAQGEISARNANESLRQATTVEDMRNQNRIEIEGIKQEGLDGRGGRTGSPSSVPNILPRTAREMRQEIESRLKDFDYNTIEPQAVDELLDLATRLFQDPDSGVFKNSAGAVQEVLDMLEMGQLDTLREQTKSSQGLLQNISRLVPFTGVPLSGSTTSLTRVPPGDRGLPDISTVPGIPAGSRYGNRTAQGIEILDRNGKLIGHGRLPE